MPNDSPRLSAIHACELDAGFLPTPGGAAEFSSLVAHRRAAKQRLVHLARAIETDVIPRLVQAHRQSPAAQGVALESSPAQSVDQVIAFVELIVGDCDADLQLAVDDKRRAGLSIEGLYLELFAPAARMLGQMWEDDTCDFSTVTVALGRLQRLLRELGPSFGAEIEHPSNGRRVLLAQPADEQHSFGLSMVAEFFRRDGWDVFGVVGGSTDDPASRVRKEWADVVGFSIGSERRMDWLRQRIAAVRAASRNTSLVVMVGGPIFSLDPERVASVGADATARDAKEAPRVAARLLMSTRIPR